MRIAFAGDIHSNLYALDAVLGDAAQRGIDRYVFCGDYVCDGPDTDCIVKKVQRLAFVAVRGNREQYMLDFRTSPRRDRGNPQFCSLTWIYERLSAESLDWFEQLPDSARFSEAGVRFNVSHGSPYAQRDNIKEYGSETALERMISDFDDDVFVFAHTHRQYNREYNGRLFINPGSVGMPTDSHGFKYSVLDTESGAVEQYAVPYEYDEVAEYYKSHNFLGDNGFWGELFLSELRDNEECLPRFIAHLHGFAEKSGVPRGEPIPPAVFYRAADCWAKRYF